MTLAKIWAFFAYALACWVKVVLCCELYSCGVNTDVIHTFCLPVFNE